MRYRLPRIMLGRPIVVSQAPASIREWGPWQFPKIERLADGRLHVSFHIAADSATAYGLPEGHAVSSDNGMTWQEVSEPVNGGLLLPNGDRLRAISMRSLSVEGLSLPAPLAIRRGSYGGTYTIYMLEDLPPDLRAGWRFARCPAGRTEWVEETAVVHLPGEIRYTTAGVFVFPSVHRLRLAPDGALWGLIYPWRAPQRVLRERWLPVFLRSTDHGRTWYMHSEIAYQGDPQADPACEKRDGFTEPEIAFLPDGSVLALVRTTDGNGVGPLYSCSSSDGGQTWSTPQVFDTLGVWPTLLTLRSGVTLVGYGRPGLFVRATADASGRVWTERVTVVEPGTLGKDTCSYCDLIALDDTSAMIVYSHFNWPDSQGTPRKTILVRSVSIL